MATTQYRPDGVVTRPIGAYEPDFWHLEAALVSIVVWPATTTQLKALWAAMIQPSSVGVRGRSGYSVVADGATGLAVDDWRTGVGVALSPSLMSISLATTR
jgi:hypothetical protein